MAPRPKEIQLILRDSWLAFRDSRPIRKLLPNLRKGDAGFEVELEGRPPQASIGALCARIYPRKPLVHDEPCGYQERASGSHRISLMRSLVF